MLTQIINGRILTPQGWLKDGSVILRDNKILEVTNSDLAIIGAEIIDVKGMNVVPGGIEMHVHGGGGRDFLRIFAKKLQFPSLSYQLLEIVLAHPFLLDFQLLKLLG